MGQPLRGLIYLIPYSTKYSQTTHPFVHILCLGVLIQYRSVSIAEIHSVVVCDEGRKDHPSQGPRQVNRRQRSRDWKTKSKRAGKQKAQPTGGERPRRWVCGPCAGFPSRKPLLPRLRFYRCEAIQVCLTPRCSICDRSMLPTRQNSCVLMELQWRCSLGCEVASQALSLPIPSALSQPKVLGRTKGGTVFKALLGDLVTCLSLQSIAGAGQKCLARPL